MGFPSRNENGIIIFRTMNELSGNGRNYIPGFYIASSTCSALRKGNNTLVLFHPLPECITCAIKPKYHSNPCYYMYLYRVLQRKIQYLKLIYYYTIMAPAFIAEYLILLSSAKSSGCRAIALYLFHGFGEVKGADVHLKQRPVAVPGFIVTSTLIL